MLRLTLTISKSSKMVAFSPQSTTETCSRRSEWILKSNLFLKMIQLVFNCANSKTRTKATLAPLLWIKSTSMETTATTNLSHYKVIAGVTFRKWMDSEKWWRSVNRISWARHPIIIPTVSIITNSSNGVSYCSSMGSRRSYRTKRNSRVKPNWTWRTQKWGKVGWLKNRECNRPGRCTTTTRKRQCPRITVT